MRRIVSAVALASLLGSGDVGIAGATQAPAPPSPVQPQPPDRPALKEHQHAVVVTGCIRAKRIERPVFGGGSEDLPYAVLNALTFMLDGPKELMRQIERDHQNHEDQITGIAIVPPSVHRAPADVTSRRVGPISVGIGTRQATSTLQDVPLPIKVKVESFTHVQGNCVSR